MKHGSQLDVVFASCVFLDPDFRREVAGSPTTALGDDGFLNIYETLGAKT